MTAHQFGFECRVCYRPLIVPIYYPPRVIPVLSPFNWPLGFIARVARFPSPSFTLPPYVIYHSDSAFQPKYLIPPTTRISQNARLDGKRYSRSHLPRFLKSAERNRTIISLTKGIADTRSTTRYSLQPRGPSVSSVRKVCARARPIISSASTAPLVVGRA